MPIPTPSRHVPVIGLTGGIGAGKSAVARCFGEHGVGWVDADDVAREIVMPGEPALAEIVSRHGPAILQADGQLDRRALRNRVFEDPVERRWLEQTTHPRIRQRLHDHLQRLRESGSPYCLLVSPLLIETDQRQIVDRILVVDVPEATQLARTATRDGVEHRQIEAIMAAQSSRDTRLAAADDVIDNSGDRQSLQTQVDRLDAYYRQLASSFSRIHQP
ncbi:dephospho-CoA kinase [Salinicola avicenniae]|uniref:dephospho-CoA kinase n=1 Tax=Salinicola avicenniae TaxID=2916836 RepID=UPI002074A867|nr:MULTISPECIES: dephospho-CoA kinase [unclassified Salinicola]